MKLLCGEILDHLWNRPIIILDNLGFPIIAPPKHKLRSQILVPLLANIHKAEKFIFDSGSDRDPEQVAAVRDTAFNMIEANLFHLPFQRMWVEDPFEDQPDNARFLYYLEETETEVVISHFTYYTPEGLASIGIKERLVAEADLMAGRKFDKMHPRVTCHPFKMHINLEHPSHDFMVVPAPKSNFFSTAYQTALGEVVYSVKKMMVTLASQNPQRERVAAATTAPGRYRSYVHTVIRVPVEQPTSSGSTGTGVSHAGKPRRAKLVRGYVWGKNTRPVALQRWIAPYWRTQVQLAEAAPTHYQIGRLRTLDFQCQSPRKAQGLMVLPAKFMPENC